MAQAKQVSKKTTTTKQTRSKKPVVKTLSTKQTEKGIVQEERYHKIAEVAYIKAEARGFEGDTSIEDWLQAEKEIDNDA